MSKKRKSAKGPKPPEFPMVVETFNDPRWEMSQIRSHRLRADPHCWNGEVSVRRYRITAELIEEPDEVIRERIRKLWRECNNSHHWGPLKAMASMYGMELDYEDCGKDRKR